MLVLTRKGGESVEIGDAISIKVLAISGNRVKLGFSAPPEVAIRRKEVLDSVSLNLAGWRDEPVDSQPRLPAVC